MVAEAGPMPVLGMGLLPLRGERTLVGMARMVLYSRLLSARSFIITCTVYRWSKQASIQFQAWSLLRSSICSRQFLWCRFLCLADEVLPDEHITIQHSRVACLTQRALGGAMIKPLTSQLCRLFSPKRFLRCSSVLTSVSVSKSDFASNLSASMPLY